MTHTDSKHRRRLQRLLDVFASHTISLGKNPPANTFDRTATFLRVLALELLTPLHVMFGTHIADLVLGRAAPCARTLSLGTDSGNDGAEASLAWIYLTHKK
jgi:hypothetical protein